MNDFEKAIAVHYSGLIFAGYYAYTDRFAIGLLIFSVSEYLVLYILGWRGKH